MRLKQSYYLIMFLFLLLPVNALVSNITVSSPQNSNYLFFGSNLSLNYSILGLNLDSIWYNYNDTNQKVSYVETINNTNQTGSYSNTYDGTCGVKDMHNYSIYGLGGVWYGYVDTIAGNPNCEEWKHSEIPNDCLNGTYFQTRVYAISDSDKSYQCYNYTSKDWLTMFTSYIGGYNQDCSSPSHVTKFCSDYIYWNSSTYDGNYTFLATSKNNLTIYANDSLNNIKSSLVSWDYNVFQNSISYNQNTTSGASEQMTINITVSSAYSGITVLLNYNNTNYTMSSSDSGYNKIYSYNLNPPLVLTSSIIPFKFYILLSNSTSSITVVSNIYNQTVSPFLLDNCGTYTHKLLNFTMLDEETLNSMNGTILITANIYSLGKTNLVAVYNQTINYLSNQTNAICLADSINQSYTLEYTIQHYGDNTYFKRYRNIQNMTISNSTLPQNLYLYNLLTASGYSFQIIVVGNILTANGNGDLLVDAQKQYIPLNTFYSVESSITSTEGIAISHLVPATAVYNFIISYNGQILGTFNNYQVQCQNVATGQCSITLNLAQATATAPVFTNYGNISQTFLLDNSTHILYQTFSSIDSKSYSVTSIVLKADGYGNTTICNNTVIGTSGTIQCTIPNTYQNTSIFVQTFVDGEYIGTHYFSQGANPDFSGVAMFIELLMFSSLVLLFIGHPSTIIIGAIVGIVSPILLIYSSTGGLGEIISSVIYYVVAGIIFIWQISRKI